MKKSTKPTREQALWKQSFDATLQYFMGNPDGIRPICQAGLEEASRHRSPAWQAIFELWLLRVDLPAEYLETATARFDEVFSVSLPPITRAELVLALAAVYLASFDHSLYLKALRLIDVAFSDAALPEQKWLLFHRRGYILSSLHRSQEALEAYMRALEFGQDHPATSITRSNIGISHFESGDYQKALGFFEAAVAVAKKGHYAGLPYNNLGFLYYTLGQFDKVDSCLRKTIRTGNSVGHAYYNLGLLRLSEWHRNKRKAKALSEAQQFFMDSYTHFKAEKRPFDILSAYYMEKLVESRRNPGHKDYRGISGEQEELSTAARLLLELLLDDISNFIGYSALEMSQCREYLLRPRTVNAGAGGELVVLRRWNSYTPGIPIPERGKGGGYFLSWRGKGIAIDPGFDFLANFHDAGFSLRDIDAILVTHGHIDHCRDVEPILTLLRELNEQTESDTPHEVDLLVSVGVAGKEIGWVTRLRQLVRSVVTLNADTSLSLQGLGLPVSLDVVRAKHQELLTDRYAVGVVIHLEDESGADALRIGYTSDTGWYEGLNESYEGCDVLLAHVGTVSFREVAMLARYDWRGDLSDCLMRGSALLDDRKILDLGFRDKGDPERYMVRKEPYDVEQAKEQEHLGFTGLYRLARSVWPRIMIVSEFGLELGVYRHKVASALRLAADQLRSRNGRARRAPPQFLTGDIGLRIRLPGLRVQCCECGEYSAGRMTEVCVRRLDKRVVQLCPAHKPQSRRNGLPIRRTRSGGTGTSRRTLRSDHSGYLGLDW